MQGNIAGQQSPTGLLASWLGFVQELLIVYSSVCRSVLDAWGRGDATCIPIYGLYRYVPWNRVGFLRFLILI